MELTGAALTRAALAVLGDDRLRRGTGWVLVAIFSPVILVVVFLCALATGNAEHNNLAVGASFYGSNYSDQIPVQYQDHIAEMRDAFTILDLSVTAVNAATTDGSGLDPIQVKAIFYALCFGEDAPSRRAADRFVNCFYIVDGESVRALPLERVYANLAILLGREIGAEDRANVTHIYAMIAGTGGTSFDGAILHGGERSVALDVSSFAAPTTKNAADLVTYAVHAWESGWGYVWGTYGNVLTEALLDYKLEQYPDGVGSYESFIRDNWLGGRVTDCVGLIKGYGWLDTETMTFAYGANGMPDVGANQMYYAATVSGTIDTMPDTPGLAVWHEGHIGVYIGGGQVIEAMGTRQGVVKTALDGRGWTHWLEIPYINYE